MFHPPRRPHLTSSRFPNRFHRPCKFLLVVSSVSVPVRFRLPADHHRSSALGLLLAGVAPWRRWRHTWAAEVLLAAPTTSFMLSSLGERLHNQSCGQTPRDLNKAAHHGRSVIMLTTPHTITNFISSLTNCAPSFHFHPSLHFPYVCAFVSPTTNLVMNLDYQTQFSPQNLIANKAIRLSPACRKTRSSSPCKCHMVLAASQSHRPLYPWSPNPSTNASTCSFSIACKSHPL